MSAYFCKYNWSNYSVIDGATSPYDACLRVLPVNMPFGNAFGSPSWRPGSWTNQ